jgi:hypothetical protein
MPDLAGGLRKFCRAEFAESRAEARARPSGCVLRGRPVRSPQASVSGPSAVPVLPCGTVGGPWQNVRAGQRSLPGSSSAANLAAQRHSVKPSLPSSGSRVNHAAGAGGGIRREANASGSEHRRQPMRRSTHTGLRPTECRSAASASFATPAPHRQQTTGNPKADDAGCAPVAEPRRQDTAGPGEQHSHSIAAGTAIARDLDGRCP